MGANFFMAGKYVWIRHDRYLIIKRMIFDSIFLKELFQETFPLSIQKEESNNDFIVGYIVSKIDSAFSAFFYNESFFKNNNRFCVALQSSILKNKPKESSDNTLAEHLGAVLFNIQYYKLNGNPVIIILTSKNESPDNLLGKLKDTFEYLGYDRVYYCLLDETMSIVKTNIAQKVETYNYLTNDSLKVYSQTYYNLLEINNNSHLLLLFFLPNMISFDNFYSEINQIEEKFKKNNPLKSLLLEESTRFRKEVEKYEINIYLLKKDLESKQAYIASLNIPESTMKKVANFYYYEYEILPKWYKQFGHIIKVITGKRTFRSLFSDKVKKYKD